jgi:hypothetical protein
VAGISAAEIEKKVVALMLVGGLFISGLVSEPVDDGLGAQHGARRTREYYRQRDTADVLEYLMKEAKKLWTLARAGECEAEDCRQRSREVQNAIYTERANSPLVMPFLYRVKRLQLEDEMNEGAADFLRDLGDLSTPGSPPDESSTTRASE